MERLNRAVIRMGICLSAVWLAGLAGGCMSTYTEVPESNGNGNQPTRSSCQGNQLLGSDGVCRCPTGLEWDGSLAWCTTPACSYGRLWDGATCTCPFGTVWDGGYCSAVTASCTGNSYAGDDGLCYCPSGTEWDSGQQWCVAPTNTCPGNSTPGDDGACYCPAGSVWNESQQWCIEDNPCGDGLIWNGVDTCSCPQGTVSNGYECVPPNCPDNSYPNGDDTCSCYAGYHIEGDSDVAGQWWCAVDETECPGGSIWNGYQCECPSGSTWTGYECAYASTCPANSFLGTDGDCYCYDGYLVSASGDQCIGDGGDGDGGGYCDWSLDECDALSYVTARTEWRYDDGYGPTDEQQMFIVVTNHSTTPVGFTWWTRYWDFWSGGSATTIAPGETWEDWENSASYVTGEFRYWAYFEPYECPGTCWDYIPDGPE